MKIQKIRVGLSGLCDIMFDRFIDHSREKRPPDQKLYLAPGNRVVMPQDNIVAHLFSDDPPGCARTFEGKQGKTYMRMGMAHIFIDESLVPMTCQGKEIIFGGFDGQFWIHQGSPRVKQGSRSIKQEVKERPVLKLPWELKFGITILENTLINETKLYNWLVAGGLQIGLGTYRPRFGRFEVKEFNSE